jgi:amino acid transporter
MKELLIGLTVFIAIGLIVTAIIFIIGLIMNLIKREHIDMDSIITEGSWGFILFVFFAFIIVFCYMVGKEILSA